MYITEINTAFTNKKISSQRYRDYFTIQLFAIYRGKTISFQSNSI